jgi:hypothetical protein
MKRNISYIVFAIILIFVSAIIYYTKNYTDTGILKNVTSRKGYSLNIREESVVLELFIKPEWIPLDSNKPLNLNLKLYEKDNTNIILKQVWNRGEDIYFSFDTSYNLNHTKGRFLYNGVFNEDKTFTTRSTPNDFFAYDLNLNTIKVGQTGYEPNSAFSFGIGQEQQAMIRKGFYVKFSGMILYEYSSTK